MPWCIGPVAKEEEKKKKLLLFPGNLVAFFP